MRVINIVAAVGVVVLSGCASSAADRRRDEIAARYLQPVDVIKLNYNAASALLMQAKGELAFDRPILIATVVKTDDLDSSSTLGRLTSEHIATKFTNAGYKVVEMKLGKSVYMKRNEGELALTREISSIAKNYDAQGVVVGSYGMGGESVYMNVKLVRPNMENVVIAAYDYTIPRNKEVDDLARPKFSQ